MSRESWTSLAERVERTGGADREIDWTVTQLANPAFAEDLRTMAREYTVDLVMAGALDKVEDPFKAASMGAVTPYTASVDAVLALMSETLPGLSYVIIAGPDQPCFARIIERDESVRCSGSGATPALATLSAYCTARASLVEAA